MINNQPPEPYAKGDGTTIDFHTMFYTIQGEGPFTGQTSVFIRLAGCNLQCPGCDTLYTEGRQLKPVEWIVRECMKELNLHDHCDLIVITGGEPTRQNLDVLIPELIDRTGRHVQIESNGVLGFSQVLLGRVAKSQLSVVVSPKTSRIHASCVHALAFKYVMQAGFISDEDGLPTVCLGHKVKDHVARPPEDWIGYERPASWIYVNPMDEVEATANRANMIAARDTCLKHGYVLGSQLHKAIDLP